jgi:phospholipase A1
LPGRTSAAEAPPVTPPGAALMEETSTGEGSALSQRWELDKGTKQGTFLFRPYKPVYFLPVRYGEAPNDQPRSPSRGAAPHQGLDRIETKFQLSFKVKAAESLFGTPADLWIGYTQQSQWQVYNGAISRPFRETNHEPELMLVIPTRYRVLGLSGRFVNLALVHQSNGRSNPLSRSWNRVYAQFGFERGPFTLFIRPWYRLPEDPKQDDNSDLEDYVGYGDALGVYRWRRSTLSLLLRDNLGGEANRGTLQVEYSFPIHGRLEGFVQGFWGYGESLIDYNHREAVLGLGVLLIDWM